MKYHSFIPSQQKKCQCTFLQTMDIQVLYIWFADTWHFLVLWCFFMTHQWFAETDMLHLITWLNEVNHSRALLPSSCWVSLAIISWLYQPAYRPISFGCAKHKVQHYNSWLLKSNLKWQEYTSLRVYSPLLPLPQQGCTRTTSEWIFLCIKKSAWIGLKLSLWLVRSPG